MHPLKEKHWTGIEHLVFTHHGFLFLLHLTGIIWSFKWVENTMYWMTNSKKEERKALPF
jgi:hypothetical protein